MKMNSLRSVFLLLISISSVSVCLCYNNGLGRTPPMGWNSWNKFACKINETLIMSTAQALVSTGLRDAGYVYLNLDDCWSSTRNADGIIQADPVTFPSGMKHLGDYLHSLGLNFGIYSDAGTATCESRPGSLNFEEVDAKTFASWGVDYLKYDNCNNTGLPPKVRYPPMSKALNNSGRPIFFSMCEWGIDDPATWAPDIANSWRTSGDIRDEWDSMLFNLDEANKWSSYAGPYRWNDPDMLEVGNGGMTDVEYQSHFSLWALIKAPLLIGCDITNMSPNTYRILTNREVIAINQDPLGYQGRKLTSQDGLEVWGGALYDKSFCFVLFNRSNQTATITVEWSLTGNDLMAVRDLWQGVDLGLFPESFSAPVVSHGVVMIKALPIT